MKRNRVGAVLVALVAIACGRNGPLTLDGSRIEDDANASDLSLCGFPASQLVEDPGGRGHIGRLRVGQRVPLVLTGNTDRVRTVSWWSDSLPAPRPPVLRLTGTGRFTAILEAVAAGGDDPRDYAFAGASVEFKDESGRGFVPAACETGWKEADRIVVVP
jgi:hypothetical protein